MHIRVSTGLNALRANYFMKGQQLRGEDDPMVRFTILPTMPPMTKCMNIGTVATSEAKKTMASHMFGLIFTPKKCSGV